MVVLTLVTQQNGKTIYFEEPIPRVDFMKLISCSLYNRWDNLKREGSATLGDNNDAKSITLPVGQVLPGHYNLERIALEIGNLFIKYNYKLETEINQPLGQLVIKNSGSTPIELDRDLAGLLGIGRKLKFINFIKRLRSPTAYFIHCDLIDKQKNLFNGKRSISWPLLM